MAVREMLRAYTFDPKNSPEKDALKKILQNTGGTHQFRRDLTRLRDKWVKLQREMLIKSKKSEKKYQSVEMQSVVAELERLRNKLLKPEELDAVKFKTGATQLHKPSKARLKRGKARPPRDEVPPAAPSIILPPMGGAPEPPKKKPKPEGDTADESQQANKPPRKNIIPSDQPGRAGLLASIRDFKRKPKEDEDAAPGASAPKAGASANKDKQGMGMFAGAAAMAGARRQQSMTHQQTPLAHLRELVSQSLKTIELTDDEEYQREAMTDIFSTLLKIKYPPVDDTTDPNKEMREMQFKSRVKEGVNGLKPTIAMMLADKAITRMLVEELETRCSNHLWVLSLVDDKFKPSTPRKSPRK
jgi:hypothetical protein